MPFGMGIGSGIEYKTLFQNMKRGKTGSNPYVERMDSKTLGLKDLSILGSLSYNTSRRGKRHSLNEKKAFL